MRPLAVAWRILRLSGRDWADLWRAEWALLVSQVRVWTTPIGQLVSPAVPVSSPGSAASVNDAARTARGLELSTAVRRAAKYGPVRSACLVRSLALVRLLDGEHIGGARLRVGVRRADHKLEAHAWVELDTRIINDTAEHAGLFSPLADVREMLPGLQSTRA